MGRARVKPNIQDIKDLLIGIWVIFIAQEAGFGPLLIPCICALSLKGKFLSNCGKIWLPEKAFVYLRVNKVQKAQVLIKINKGYERIHL